MEAEKVRNIYRPPRASARARAHTHTHTHTQKREGAAQRGGGDRRDLGEVKGERGEVESGREAEGRGMEDWGDLVLSLSLSLLERERWVGGRNGRGGRGARERMDSTLKHGGYRRYLTIAGEPVIFHLTCMEALRQTFYWLNLTRFQAGSVVAAIMLLLAQVPTPPPSPPRRK
jgi:hypothetical protein